MLTYDLIANVYPAAFAASHGIAYRHDEGPNHAHRPRVNSTKKHQNRNSNSQQHRPSRKRKTQQQFYQDACDSPSYCLESGFVQRENPLYDPGNNNDIDLVDLNQLKVDHFHVFLFILFVLFV